MKKKGGGTLAGIPRASGERNSPAGNGASSNPQVSPFHRCIVPFVYASVIFIFITPLAMFFLVDMGRY
jgi:hypothetical protein